MKKNIYKWFVSALFCAFLLASCDKYLDLQPKKVQLLETVDDYDLWLNSTDLEASFACEMNLLADNIDNPTIQNPTTSGSSNRIYTWQDQFSVDVKTSPLIWSNHYQSIYYFNTVLKEIDEASGSEDMKKSLKAEALLGRAFEYLYLVNLYGKVYDVNTAEEDLAVPFVTSNDLEDEVPDRSTVQEIYDYIIADITTAIPDLPEDNSTNRYRGSVAAAYSILARAYLYMGDYTKAAQNAQLALDNGPNEVLDYSTMAHAGDIPDLQSRTDAIYSRYFEGSKDEEIPTLAFLQSFDPTDLRLEFYYSDLGDYSFTTRGETKYQTAGVSGVINGDYVFPDAHTNWGPSVAEMRLILAEVAARDNELEAACDELDLVRKCRFREADYVKLESTGHTQEEILQKVLQERTFEFPYCGLRWFDMRRLDAEGRMPEVNRHDAGNNVIATLSPSSNKYTLQIPIQVLYFHSDWTQNQWDEE